jgi:hypothetical protein
VLLCLTGAFAAGCKRKPPPPAAQPAALSAKPGAAPGVPCPPVASIAAPLAEPGRTVHVGCVDYSSYFWAATALSVDDAGKSPPRLTFVTGGPGMGMYAFDVDPGPTKQIEELIKTSTSITARAARTRSQQHLLRMGVVGQKDGGASSEIALVLQLVAHSAPQIVWAGNGDQVSVGADGCIVERTLEFEMPFRRDIQVFTQTRAHPPAGGKQVCSPQGPGTQDTYTARGVPLKSGRALGTRDGGPR